MKVSMTWQRLQIYLCLMCALACLMLPCRVMAAEYHGAVTFNSLPLPGATVTATQDGKKFVTVTDEQGLYSFADLPDGTWSIQIEMVGFTTMKQDISIAATSAPAAPAIPLELKMLPVDAMIAQTKIVKVEPVQTDLPQAPVAGATAAPAKSAKSSDAGAAPPPAPSDSASSSDGFLVNGSVNNAATSQFTLAPAFGNNRTGAKSLYNGSVGVIMDNSTFDARPYSFAGANTAKSAYNKFTGVVTFGGPLNIPHFMPHGPNFFIGYQWTRNHTASTVPAIVPTAAQLPATPPTDPAVAALLNFYLPLVPNVVGNQYNYQNSVLSNTHQDAMQVRLDKNFSPKNQGTARFAFQNTRSNNGNLFNFIDTTKILGLNAGVNWNHRFNQRFFLTTGYGFSRLRVDTIPFFKDRTNVSGEAGIQKRCTAPPTPPATTPPVMCGNDQDAAEWGPPSLSFSSGILGLSDVNSAFNRAQTDSFAFALHYYRGPHSFTFGGDFRRQENNILAQQNPRGAFQFNGTATGVSDFADFLADEPDTSSIAYGNADKYFRQSVYDAYVLDDWRLRPELTLNIGLRWEYGAPITELKGRLVNLDVAPGFSNVAAVLGNSTAGPLTGQQYPTSLIRPDKLGIEPRIGLSWRPIPGSSLVVRAGYGVYDDTSVYLSTASQMAQQAPLSTSVSTSNTTAGCTQESMETGFTPCSITPFAFGVDPNFRVGYFQTWQIAVQRDLPAALQMTATYIGGKGTRGVQHYLPNTYELGAANPCPSCPSGFTYQSSNGNSTREAVSLQLRRRLRSGFTATLQYTYSKSIDDDSSLGGQGPIAAGATSQSTATQTIAQNWLNLRGERSLSTFDQRHLLNVQIQYTTGMGLGGGTLLSGWRGRAFKEWTVLSTITAGTGLPETPIYLAAVPGSSYTGSIRPSLTGINAAPAAGSHLNLAAYQTPAMGQWGNAGRDSITGPGQFSFNATMSRTFHLNKRYTLNVELAATNILNHTVFTSWNTALNSPATCNKIANPSCTPVPAFSAPFNPLLNPGFGLPAAANPMRSVQTTARLRF